MSVETVKRYLRQWGKDTAVLELAESSATVELAAKAVGVLPERIAKTLSFVAKKEAKHDAKGGNGGKAVAAAPEITDLGCILVVAAGDARIDGKKFKDRFGLKSKMLTPEEALARTGHGVGGVCPFAVDNPAAEIYLDISLRRFPTVYPACGSANSIIELSCEELYLMSRARDWIDVCKDWQPEPGKKSGGQGENNEDDKLE